MVYKQAATFLRQAKAGSHTYLRLVENYREGDRVRQRVVLHLGRKDLLAPHLDSLVRVLQADDPAPRWVAAGQLSTPSLDVGTGLGGAPLVQ